MSPPASAHDIGVSQAELDGKHYELSVRIGPGFTLLFATPQLPQHSEFTSNACGTQNSSWKTFGLSSADGLTADYTLELPWG